jgi:hypothetical protein
MLSVVEAPATPPEAEAPRPTVTLQQVRSLWEQIRLRAEEKQKSIRGLLSRATVDAIEGNALVIGMSDAVNEGLLRDKIAILEDAIAAVTAVPLHVIIKTRGTPRPATPPGPAIPRTLPEPGPPSIDRARAPEAPADVQNGDVDLLAYARERIGGPQNSEHA